MHEIWNFFGQKHSFQALWKCQYEKISITCPRVRNPGFMQEKVQKGEFLKKDSWELKFFSCFRFLWISRRPGTLNCERVVFWLSKILYRKCGLWDPIWWQAEIKTVAEYSQSSSTNNQYYYNVIWINMLVFGTIANFWPYLIWRAASSLYKATSRATETVFDGRRVSRLRGPGEKSKKEATSHPWESKPVRLHKSVFW